MEEGKHSLLVTLNNTQYARCTVAMCYYLFRALEKAGLYEHTDEYWDIWRKMVADGCSTSIESDRNSRSECHAWGALALYELPSVVLGVRPAAPGYEKVRVSPLPGVLTSASGIVRTPHGDLKVKWSIHQGKIRKEVQCSKELLSRVCS